MGEQKKNMLFFFLPGFVSFFLFAGEVHVIKQFLFLCHKLFSNDKLKTKRRDFENHS